MDSNNSNKIMSWWDQKRSHLTYSQNKTLLFLTGAVIALTGCFLPWKLEGDLISIETKGIQIYPVFRDNGGLIPVILILALSVTLFRFKSKSRIMRIVCRGLSVCLVLLPVYHIITIYIPRINPQPVFGAPDIHIGLILLTIGSLLILVATFAVTSGISKWNDSPETWTIPMR